MTLNELPNVIIICSRYESEDTVKVFDILRESARNGAIDIIVIANEEDRKSFLNYSGLDRFYLQPRPVSLMTLYRKLEEIEAKIEEDADKYKLEEYVNDIYSYGDKTTVEDDIDRYVEQNILPLYMFDHFDLYVYKTPNGNKRELKYTYVGDSDAVKYMHKLRPDNTYGLSVVDYSEFDRKIVFNTKDQYTYEIALSLHIKKR